ncbi:MAG: hypothetical protein AB2A00_19060 [Myxococcota bacterium]
MEQAPPPNAGLCARCQHVRTVVSARGSVFVLCGRSREDPRYARYPRLPVTRCEGFEAGPPPTGEAGSAD